MKQIPFARGVGLGISVGVALGMAMHGSTSWLRVRWARPSRQCPT